MKPKTIEQIALVALIIAVVWHYRKYGFALPGISSSGALSNNVSISNPAPNGVPAFLSYNVASGFTGQTTPIDALPSGTTGTSQSAPCVACSLFPLANGAQT